MGGEGLGEELKLFAAASLDEGAADEVIDELGVVVSGTDGSHETGDPWAAAGLAEGDAAAFEELEDEFEVLEFLDGDGVELADAGEERAVAFEGDGGGGGFPFEMCVVDEDRGEMGSDLVDPPGRDGMPEEQHGGVRWGCPRGGPRGIRPDPPR